MMYYVERSLSKYVHTLWFLELEFSAIHGFVQNWMLYNDINLKLYQNNNERN
jgi:hypothetical protein